MGSQKTSLAFINLKKIMVVVLVLPLEMIHFHTLLLINFVIIFTKKKGGSHYDIFIHENNAF
jgi:hypothetical protein